MGFYESDSEQADAYREVHDASPRANLCSETVAKAAAYEASMEYKGHCAFEGKLDEPSKAKDELRRMAEEALDRIIDDKQLASLDRSRALERARQQAESIVDDNFNSYSAARRGRRLSVC